MRKRGRRKGLVYAGRICVSRLGRVMQILRADLRGVRPGGEVPPRAHRQLSKESLTKKVLVSRSAVRSGRFDSRFQESPFGAILLT